MFAVSVWIWICVIGTLKDHENLQWQGGRGGGVFSAAAYPVIFVLYMVASQVDGTPQKTGEKKAVGRVLP